MQFPSEDPRYYARELIKDSIDEQLWKKNEVFTSQLVDKIFNHKMSNHPIIEALANTEFNLQAIKIVHLEFRIAFAQIFTDSLIRLMQTTSQLEASLGAKAKIAARFLLQLNVMEELGYRPAPQGSANFYGHPGYSHYWQFTDTLTALGAPEETWVDYIAAPESLATRESLESNYDDHLRLSVILAVIETVFIRYANPWAKNTLYVCQEDISEGYHSIHVEDDEGHFVDDDHAEDNWYIVRQALTVERYQEVEALVQNTLDIWVGFVDMLMRKRYALS